MKPQNTGRDKKEKLSWKGGLISIQPRIRLWRSFDQRGHSYHGYVLKIQGKIENRESEFKIAIGKAAHEKHQFRIGDIIRGNSLPVADIRKETAEYYRTSGLAVITRNDMAPSKPPPWHGVPSDLETYRERGHRRLDKRTYGAKCQSCIWGCLMPVEMIIDQWNPSIKRYRFETFCYGPKSCPLYKAGPTRKVPGRKGMSWEEEDWVDEESVAHRGKDD